MLFVCPLIVFGAVLLKKNSYTVLTSVPDPDPNPDPDPPAPHVFGPPGPDPHL